MPGLNVLDNPDLVNQCSTSIDYTLSDKEQVKRDLEAILKNANSDKGNHLITSLAEISLNGCLIL